MKKSMLSIFFVGLLSCGLYAGDKSVSNYDEGWDDGWNPGFEEGQDDICEKVPYYIDEEFSDDDNYEKGWAKGYKKGYSYGYEKGCISNVSDFDEGWDKGYDPGFEEGKSDACERKSYHIDEEFDEDALYDKGWRKGYIKGYDKGWKSCDLTQNSMSRIGAPFRDIGYSNFRSKVITSKEGLQKFLDKALDKALSVSPWNYRSFTNILYSLLNSTDFKKENILFYRITETSGSISLKPQEPTINNGHAKVDIKRKVPEIGTADMAYYGLLYRVDKSIKDITFDNGVQEVIIENKESDQVVPKNCQAWFDGCNNCSRGYNGGANCTKRYCLVYRPQDFRCTKWK